MCSEEKPTEMALILLYLFPILVLGYGQSLRSGVDYLGTMPYCGVSGSRPLCFYFHAF